MEFAVSYFSNSQHEVRLFLADFEDAMITARFLSTISDIRFASVYRIPAVSREDDSSRVILCQFQHGVLYKQYLPRKCCSGSGGAP